MPAKSFWKKSAVCGAVFLLLFFFAVCFFNFGSANHAFAGRLIPEKISVPAENNPQDCSAEFQSSPLPSISAARPWRLRITDLRQLFVTENDPLSAISGGILQPFHPADLPGNIFLYEVNHASITERAGPELLFFV